HCSPDAASVPVRFALSVSIICKVFIYSGLLEIGKYKGSVQPILELRTIQIDLKRHTRFMTSVNVRESDHPYVDVDQQQQQQQHIHMCCANKPCKVEIDEE